MGAVLDRVAGQEAAVSFLRRAAERPHHAYVLAGPEGSGKSLVARAFVASLLCHDGGCGTCRDCTLALREHHPNEFVVEPEGRDIHIDTIRDEVWHHAYRTAPEPGRKVFVIREADRLSPPAADTLLKVLEEPPLDTVFLLLSARAQELPDTVLSRCHVVVFAALPESFVVRELEGEGIDRTRAQLVARLSGGNLGRARRMATDPEGLAFRDVAASALDRATRGAGEALAAAADILDAAAAYKKGLRAELDEELAPFMDDEGQAGGGLSGGDPADRDPVRAPGASGRARSGRPDPAGCLGDRAGSDRGHGAGAARRAAQPRPRACPGGRCRRPGRVIGGAGGRPRRARR